MTPKQKKAEADRLLNQGREESYHSQYRQALQSWQQALTILWNCDQKKLIFIRPFNDHAI